MLKRLKLAAASVVAAGSLVAGWPVAAADDFPSQAIQFIVPCSAGGGQDRRARVIATGGSNQLGQPIDVKVRPATPARWAGRICSPSRPMAIP